MRAVARPEARFVRARVVTREKRGAVRVIRARRAFGAARVREARIARRVAAGDAARAGGARGEGVRAARAAPPPSPRFFAAATADGEWTSESFGSCAAGVGVVVVEGVVVGSLSEQAASAIRPSAIAPAFSILFIGPPSRAHVSARRPRDAPLLAPAWRFKLCKQGRLPLAGPMSCEGRAIHSRATSGLSNGRSDFEAPRRDRSPQRRGRAARRRRSRRSLPRRRRPASSDRARSP